VATVPGNMFLIFTVADNTSVNYKEGTVSSGCAYFVCVTDDNNTTKSIMHGFLVDGTVIIAQLLREFILFI